MNWLTYITSVSSAIVVAVLAAFLNPRFQHAVWKKQKRREQRMEIAERFSTLHSRFIPVPAAEADSKWPFAGLVEEDALLVLIQVLFEREDTRASGNRLRKWLDTHGIQLTDGMPIGINLNACQKSLFNAGDDYVELVLRYVAAEDRLVGASKPR